MRLFNFFKTKRKKRNKLEDYVLLSFAILSFIIVIFTTLNFFIHDKIYFFGDIDKDYISAYGTFIAGTVGTLFSFAATILVWLTLKTQREDLEETKKLTQRQIDLSLKPDLYVLDTYINGYGVEANNNLLFPWFLSNQKISKFERNIGNEDSDFIVPIMPETLIAKTVNVGVGAAKSIKYNWEFDIDKIVKYINENFIDMPIEIKSMMITLEVNIKTNYGSTEMLVHYFKEEYIDIIMPHSDSNIYKNIRLPYGYILCYCIFVYLVTYYGQLAMLEGKEYYKNYPPCYLHLNYKDMADNHHKKKFELNLSGMHPSYINPDGKEFDQILFGIVSYRETKKDEIKMNSKFDILRRMY